MLVLSRKLNQDIRIGENVIVRVLGIKGNQVRLGFVAPPDVPVMREELIQRDELVQREETFSQLPAYPR